MGVCVREKQTQIVCVCVYPEKERKRDSVCVFVCVRECVCVAYPSGTLFAGIIIFALTIDACPTAESVRASAHKH